MPTYEYRCKDCNHEFETVQSFTDAALTECPSCGGALRKVFGNVGITFKGSGFYKTDSRSGSANGSTSDTSEKKADGDTGSKKESTPSSSSDSSGGSGGSGSGAKESRSSGSKGDSSGSSSKSATTPA